MANDKPKRKIIYILGNGFDLAANLPTRYTDFMALITHWNRFYRAFICNQLNQDPSSHLECPPDGRLTEDALISYAQTGKCFDPNAISQLDSIISTNIWIRYLSQCNYTEPEWAGFENEIKTALKVIDTLLREGKDIGPLDRSLHEEAVFSMLKMVFPTDDTFINENWMFRRHKTDEEIEGYRKAFISETEKALVELSEAFRLYLTEFVEKMETTNNPGILIDPQIQTYIISLNYTWNQFKRLGIKPSQIHMVHGSDEKENNLVMGIDNDSSLGNEFIRFKKFFQRIQKKTGSKYQTFLKDDPVGIHEYTKPIIIFFGHSLDPIDSDFIKEVFAKNDDNTIYIHHRDQEDYEKKVINCVEIFESDKVINAVEKGSIIFTDKDLTDISRMIEETTTAYS